MLLSLRVSPALRFKRRFLVRFCSGCQTSSKTSLEAEEKKTKINHITVINGFAEHLIFLIIIEQHSCDNMKGNVSRYVSTCRC